MGRVDGGDDGGGRDEGRRYFPLIFLLVTSFDFSPLSFFLLFFFVFFVLTFQKTSMRIWRSFRMKRVCHKIKCSVKV